MGDNQAVEGAGPRGETSGNHVVDYSGDTERVAVPGSLHKLFHEGELKGLLRCRCSGGWRVIVPGLLLPPPGFGSLRRRRDCGGANDNDSSREGKMEMGAQEGLRFEGEGGVRQEMGGH